MGAADALDIAGARIPKGMMAMMWGYNGGWGNWLAMAMMMVLFWGLIVAGIVALVRYLGGPRQNDRLGPASERPDAEELLAERFARGEIDEDEFTRRREALRSGR
jgi:putative membrane protein